MHRPVLTALAFLSSALLANAKPHKLCGKFQNLTSTDGLYNLGTNQWGDDGSGGQCVQYDPAAEPEANATAFTATWSWRENIDDVHSYPNVYLESREFPMRLNNTKSFNVDIGWTMGPGNSAVAATDTAMLNETGVKANVAFDFFIDMKESQSADASVAKYEFMVWLGSFGGAQPIGFTTTTNALTQNVGGQDFTLYQGQNSKGQNVLSWYPHTNLGTFTGDISVFLHTLVDNQLLPPDAYLGSVQFGSETTHSENNITFNANPVMMDLDVYVPKPNAAGMGATASTTLLLLSLCGTLFWIT